MSDAERFTEEEVLYGIMRKHGAEWPWECHKCQAHIDRSPSWSMDVILCVSDTKKALHAMTLRLVCDECADAHNALVDLIGPQNQNCEHLPPTPPAP